MTRNDHNNPRHPDHHAAAARRASHHPAHHPSHHPIHHAKHEHAPAHEPAGGHAHHPQHPPEHGPRRQWGRLRRAAIRGLRQPLVRRLFWGTTLALGLVTVAIAALWWRLSIGPIELDIATPWLKAAIEENFGGKHTVSVGGTQLERDEDGRVSLRLRDITVRDADGTVVASAPKAEVGLSGMSLLSGTCAGEKPQSGRRRNGGAHREERQRDRVRRRQQAADRDGCASAACGRGRGNR